MKKTLLMTWFNQPNYGTLLQCDATVNLLKERYGIDADVANYTPIGKRDAKSIVRKIFSLHTWRRRARIITGRIKQQKESQGFKKKQQMVCDFLGHFSFAMDGKAISSSNDFEELNKCYSVFISGSDQIWNPDFLNERFLLDFVSNDKQCISIASSVSKEFIDEGHIAIYKRLLPKYKAITVREEGNVDQLKQISGKEVQAILDPTILYGSIGWKKRIISSDKKQYFLAYILGTSEYVRKTIVEASKQIKEPLYYFPHMDGMYTKADSVLKENGIPLWGESPYKWIGWIADADRIVTDSFHMTVFSILFHKSFIVIPKEEGHTSQNNRILNILKVVGLEDRFVDYDKLIQKIFDEDTIDWEEIDKRLEKARQKSLGILDDIIDGLRWEDEN